MKNYFAPVVLFSSLLFLMGMGGLGGPAPVEKTPVPEKNFNARVLDHQGVQTSLSQVSFEGKVFLVGKRGDATVTIPFDKISQVEIKGQEAMLQFVADHPQTREALESALPRLREMFAAGSLTLTGANVTGEAFSPHAGTGHGQRFDQSSVAAQSERLMAVEDVIPAVIAVPRPPVQRSRIDLFA